MEKHLSPSILAADFSKLGEQIIETAKAGATYLHLDVMDGLFVPSISFGMPVIEAIRPCTDIVFDVHMMVKDPERYIEVIRKSGADIITIHVEACDSVKDTLLKIRELGAKSGLSLNPATPVSKLREYLPYCDMVLIMSVNPGFGGQSFIDSSYDKITELVELREELGLDFDIEIDGGINKENVSRVVELGVNIIVAGSAIFKGDITANTEFFLDRLK